VVPPPTPATHVAETAPPPAPAAVLEPLNLPGSLLLSGFPGRRLRQPAREAGPRRSPGQRWQDLARAASDLELRRPHAPPRREARRPREGLRPLASCGHAQAGALRRRPLPGPLACPGRDDRGLARPRH